jgi:hypothetical protein
MIAKSGSAYPDAVEWALPHLRPIEGHALFWLDQTHPRDEKQRDDLIGQFPKPTLQLLSKLVSSSTLPAWEKPTLKKILERLSQSWREGAAEPEFQVLFNIATH